VAVRSFLKVPDIPGPSEIANHKGEIEVLAFSWGVSQSGFKSGDPGGSGMADFEDLLLVARTSEASPHLWQACASGKRFPTTVLTCRRGGREPVDFLKVTLTDVSVSSYELDASDGEPPLDQFTLVYTKIETEFTPVDKSGKPKPSVKAGWDVRRNRQA
jgi:type VI secretion system secreted protein Hcp